jgi:ankyrin repeat protein
MTPAPLLKLLKTEEPFRPAMSSFFAEVSSQHDSSLPTIVQTPHRTEEFASPHTASTTPQSSRSLRRESGKSKIIQRESLIEIDLVEALRCLQVRPNFQEIVSTTNNWGQTLAHLSIFYGYLSLLHSLVDWRISLTIADGNGFTALHYAYMKGDLDCVRILRRGGAPETVMDKLGRTPLDLQPEGFSTSIDNDAKVAVELDSVIPSNRWQE